jgi:hypothetical protein
VALFRSFRPRIALLTGVLAAIVFGLFSLVTYAIIIKELENSVDTRIMIEAPDAHRDGLRTRVEREGRIARPIVEEEVGDPREVFAYNVTWIRNGVNETLIKSENWPAGLATEVASYGEGKTIQPTDVLNIIRGKRRSRSSDSSERGRGGPRPPLLEGERRDGGGYERGREASTASWRKQRTTRRRNRQGTLASIAGCRRTHFSLPNG